LIESKNLLVLLTLNVWNPGHENLACSESGTLFLLLAVVCRVLSDIIAEAIGYYLLPFKKFNVCNNLKKFNVGLFHALQSIEVNMKLKKTIITILMILGITTSPTLTYAGNYAIRGLWIGAASGGALGAFGVYASGLNCDENSTTGDCDAGPVLSGLVGGGLIGGVIGLGIGALFPKEPKVSIVPVISGTPEEFSAGFNLSTRF
jgi:hypothetical protein